MIKGIGLIMIVGSCSAMGFFMNKSMRARVAALGSFLSALGIMKAEVVFRALPVPDILGILKGECRGPAGDFFGKVGAHMAKSGDSFWASVQPQLPGLRLGGLQEKDVRHITSALHALGRYDSAAQAEAIDAATRALERELEAAGRELAQKGRLYRAIGVTVGIMLALIVV